MPSHSYPSLILYYFNMFIISIFIASLKISTFLPSSRIFETTTPNKWQEANLEEFQIRGERLLIKILGIDNPEDASQYVNCDVAIKHEQLPTLNKGEYYWRDLIGLKVLNQNEVELGVVSEIIETGANDVFVVTGNGESETRVLIPYVMDIYVKRIDLVTHTIHIDWVIDN